MKNSEIKELTTEQLQEELKKSTKELHDLRFSHAVSPIENPLRIRHARRHVARLNTELKARAYQIAEEKVNAGAITSSNLHEVSQKDFPAPMKKRNFKKVLGRLS